MGQATTILFALMLVAGGPIAEEEAAEPELDVEPDVDLQADPADEETAQATASVDGDETAGASLEARASEDAGDTRVHAETSAPEQVDASLTPTTMTVRLADGQQLELDYTPPELADDAVADADPEVHDPEPEAQAAESAAPSASSDDNEDGSQLVWAIAPATGLAAAAAVQQALPAGRWLRRLLSATPLAPLYSRISRQDVLDHESRAAIYDLLEKRAGLSLETACEELDLARSTARHHVRKLEEADMIEHTRLGRTRLHHLVGQRHRAVREHVLRHDTRRAVHEAVEDEARTITEVSEAIDANPGSVHFHLQKLEEVGLVETTGERGKQYRARNGEARDEPVFEPVGE